MWAGMRQTRKPIVADPSVQREDLKSSDQSGDPNYNHRTLVHVAVGVLLREDGTFLLTSRPTGKPYAGYWEFPGGKFEVGESGEQALYRELKEELGILIDFDATEHWQSQRVDYPHALVELHFYKVTAFTGLLQPLEGLELAWSHLPVKVAPVVPGTVPVLEWLAEERGYSGPTH